MTFLVSGTTQNKSMGWIGVDLDGTLVHSEDWRGMDYVGTPIPEMQQRVKNWLSQGRDVRVFTARVAPLYVPNASRTERLQAEKALWAIEDWCEEHFQQRLQVTAVKDFDMEILYDDRCVPVETNTGRLLSEPTQKQSPARMPTVPGLPAPVGGETLPRWGMAEKAHRFLHRNLSPTRLR